MELNWECCIICQKDTVEPLRGPGTSDGDNTDAYSSFLSNVQQFRAIDALPTKLYFGNVQTEGKICAKMQNAMQNCLPSDHPQNIVYIRQK